MVKLTEIPREKVPSEVGKCNQPVLNFYKVDSLIELVWHLNEVQGDSRFKKIF